MNVEALLETLQAKADGVDPIGSTLKFKLDDQVLFVDGTGERNRLSLDDKEADCTISTTMATFEKLRSGKTNPMMAVMMGKIKIKGDMSIAMKRQSLLK